MSGIPKPVQEYLSDAQLDEETTAQLAKFLPIICGDNIPNNSSSFPTEKELSALCDRYNEYVYDEELAKYRLVCNRYNGCLIYVESIDDVSNNKPFIGSRNLKNKLKTFMKQHQEFKFNDELDLMEKIEFLIKRYRSSVGLKSFCSAAIVYSDKYMPTSNRQIYPMCFPDRLLLCKTLKMCLGCMRIFPKNPDNEHKIMHKRQKEPYQLCYWPAQKLGKYFIAVRTELSYYRSIPQKLESYKFLATTSNEIPETRCNKIPETKQDEQSEIEQPRKKRCPGVMLKNVKVKLKYPISDSMVRILFSTNPSKQAHFLPGYSADYLRLAILESSIGICETFKVLLETLKLNTSIPNISTSSEDSWFNYLDGNVTFLWEYTKQGDRLKERMKDPDVTSIHFLIELISVNIVTYLILTNPLLESDVFVNMRSDHAKCVTIDGEECICFGRNHTGETVAVLFDPYIVKMFKFIFGPLSLLLANYLHTPYGTEFEHLLFHHSKNENETALRFWNNACQDTSKVCEYTKKLLGFILNGEKHDVDTGLDMCDIGYPLNMVGRQTIWKKLLEPGTHYRCEYQIMKGKYDIEVEEIIQGNITAVNDEIPAGNVWDVTFTEDANVNEKMVENMIAKESPVEDKDLSQTSFTTKLSRKLFSLLS